MADVFISYARESKDRVEAIAHALEAEGFTIWWDAELPPHRTYAEVIDEQIDAAKAVVVVWSQAARASQWVRAEADKARNQAKLVQTIVEGVIPPLPFDQIHAADLTHWRGDASDPQWRRVRDSVAALVGGETPRAAQRGQTRRRNGAKAPWGALIGVGALAAAGAFYVLAWPQLKPGAAPVAQAPATQTIAAQTTARTENTAARLPAGVEHRLAIPAGYAFDLDAGAISDRITPGSDFVIAEIGGGDWFLDQATTTAGSRPDTAGRPTPALCAGQEYFYRNYLGDSGEYNCFKTGDGREGALIRQRDEPGFDGAVITYVFWDD